MQGEWLFGCLLALVGFKIAHTGYLYRRSLAKAREWPSTQGTITRSEVSRSETGVWYADVEYSYWVDGTAYSGSVVNIDGELRVGFTDRYAMEKARRYPQGSSVMVHFCREEPELAFLETAPSSASTLRIVVGLVFIAAGVGVGLIPGIR
jgi:hypothetical protein